MSEAGFMTMAMAREQVAGLEQLVQRVPRADLAVQLAACYSTLGKVEAALELLQVAWEKKRDWKVAMNFCVCLRQLGRFEEAAAFSEWAYFAEPENIYLRLLHGESLLRAGLWKQAWPLYDTGRPTKIGERMRLGLPGGVRPWDGRKLSDDEFLYVLMEGGAGDRFNYSRWLSVLSERAPRWKVFCYEPEKGFFVRWLGRERVMVQNEEIQVPKDARLCWWTTVFALPANFEAGPGDVPQWGGNGLERLRADEGKVHKFDMARADALPIVGICWAAEEFSPIGDKDAPKMRSLTEAQAMRLVCATADRVHWVGAQWGKKLGFPVSSIDFESWEDTAGLLENLDALLTVDTGTLHLAGALRRPLGILLGTNSDWKFLAKGRCPFYRSAKLYRNGAGGGFDHAVDLAIAAIRELGIQAFG